MTGCGCSARLDQQYGNVQQNAPNNRQPAQTVYGLQPVSHAIQTPYIMNNSPQSTNWSFIICVALIIMAGVYYMRKNSQ